MQCTFHADAHRLYLIGQEDPSRDVLRKERLHLSQELVARFDMQSGLILDDHDGIAARDMAALPRLGGKRDAPRGIYLEGATQVVAATSPRHARALVTQPVMRRLR
jgi:hypothetical protein